MSIAPKTTDLKPGGAGSGALVSPRLVGFSRVALTGWFLVIATLSLLPQQELPSISIDDKIQHLAGYLVLGFLGFWSTHVRQWRQVLGAVVIAVGGLLEVLQLAVPGRSSEISDAVANGVGAVLGILCGWSAEWIIVTGRKSLRAATRSAWKERA